MCPSPKGDSLDNSFLLAKVVFMAFSMLVFSVPTTLANPASTASWRSVDSCITKTGLWMSGAVASSWIQSDSVTINSHLRMSTGKSE